MNYFKFIFLLAATFFVIGCSEKEKVYTTFERPDWRVDLSGYVDSPVWTVDQMGAENNPDWKIDMEMRQEPPVYTLPDANIMPVSMTAVIQLTPFLEAYLDPGDKMLAYIDEECRGEGVMKEIDGKKLFFIMIKAPATESGLVSFLYYSNKNHAVYQTTPEITFEIDRIYGDIESPIFPDFEQSGKYPNRMQATIRLPEILPGEWTESDVVAAFVGSECRGVGRFVGNRQYMMEVRGSKSDQENICFKYYNASNKNIYKSESTYPLVNLDSLGSEEHPVIIDLVSHSNMAAVVRISDELGVFANPESDQIAAFVGEECRAKGVLKMQNGKPYYIMQIKGRTSVNEKISFRYYSANNKYLYQTDAYLTFSDEGIYGSESEPEILPLDLDGKYPLQMKAYLTLPTNLCAYVQEGDQVAAFVGNECRGASIVELHDGNPYFKLDIIGRLGVGESFIIRYYNTRNRYLYETTEYYNFEHQKNLGTEESPLCLTLTNVE
ncbi:MAG: hypothetical protein RSE51_09835 [Bacteroidales bacterium]